MNEKVLDFVQDGGVLWPSGEGIDRSFRGELRQLPNRSDPIPDGPSSIIAVTEDPVAFG